MRKLILIITLLFSLSTVRAVDTLTIRQIYNFDVGDTFNYHIQSYGAFYSNNTVSLFTVVITGKWYSPAQDTLYYSRVNANVTDTISFTHLDSHLSLIDTPIGYCPCNEQFTLDTACDSTRNSFIWENGRNYLVYDYIAGLGEVAAGVGADNGSLTDTALNSYVKMNAQGQTPYYYTSISEVSADTHIGLYPNPVNDILHLSFSEADKYKAQVVITDALGQNVYSSAITAGETSHDISKVASGIYTWRLISDGQIIKTGKVVKD